MEASSLKRIEILTPTPIRRPAGKMLVLRREKCVYR